MRNYEATFGRKHKYVIKAKDKKDAYWIACDIASDITKKSRYPINQFSFIFITKSHLESMPDLKEYNFN